MQVLPVMDLMRGEVVRGVAGQRESYRPIQSQLSQASTPPAVAEAFHRSLGLSEVYLADLDAIGGGEPDWDIYRAVAGCGVKLWVDAGLVDAGQAFALLEFDPHGAVISGVVAGLETASGPKAVEEMLRAVGKGRLVFSLDMQAGRPLASSSQWGSDPVAIAEQVIAMGVERMIVLDLARVGMASGVGTLGIIRQIKAAYPRIELTAGGGVSSRAEMQELSRAGCERVLIASALHDGRIGRQAICAMAKW